MNDQKLIRQLLWAALDIVISSIIFVLPLISTNYRFFLFCIIEAAWTALNMYNVYACIKVYDVNDRETYIMGFCSAMASVFAVALFFFGLLFG